MIDPHAQFYGSVGFGANGIMDANRCRGKWPGGIEFLGGPLGLRGLVVQEGGLATWPSPGRPAAVGDQAVLFLSRPDHDSMDEKKEVPDGDNAGRDPRQEH
jgi:hypothetical protein